MSPRPRTRTDADVFEATARALTRLGPARLTLRDVGAEVGLSAATLVQRFGSRRELLLAFMEDANVQLRAELTALRAAHASPLDTVRAALGTLATGLDAPEAYAHGLAFLQEDVSDPDFRRLTRARFRLLERAVAEQLSAAVAQGELTACEPERLARLALEAANGALLLWAIHREGTPGGALERTLDTLLSPLRAAPRAARSRRAVSPLSPGPDAGGGSRGRSWRRRRGARPRR